MTPLLIGLAVLIIPAPVLEGQPQQPPRDLRPSRPSAIVLAEEARQHYRAQDWALAAEKYEAALAAQPDLPGARFFLGNCYDNLYGQLATPSERGETILLKAAENYRLAAERETDPKYRKLAREYLVAVYGPEKLNDPERAETILEQMISDEPANVGPYFHLAKLYEDAGLYDDAEQTFFRARDIRPNDPAVHTQIANFYNRQGEFGKTIEALLRSAELEPRNPRAHHTVATFYWEKAYRDHRVPIEQRLAYIERGIEAEDRALALNPDYVEALTYKNLLLRMRGNHESDDARRAAFYAEADALRTRAIELNRLRGDTGGTAASAPPRDAPPPPPPPPSPTVSLAVDGVQPVRVGGPVRPPIKLTHADAVYPEEALRAGVQGVVIIEIVIDTAGAVRHARVLRSIPLLDQAAVEAVRQWQYTPTLVDGVPKPLAITVTVDFKR